MTQAKPKPLTPREQLREQLREEVIAASKRNHQSPANGSPGLAGKRTK